MKNMLLNHAPTCNAFVLETTLRYRSRLPSLLRILWRKNMVARDGSQIARQENTLGRRYSRFQPLLRPAHEHINRLRDQQM
jgi:hypothetical protein